MSGARSTPAPAPRRRRLGELFGAASALAGADVGADVGAGAGTARRAGTIDVGTATDVAVTGLTLDSRDVRPGELYLALPGRATHGLVHAADAAARGAVAVATVPGALDAHPEARAALAAASGPDGSAPIAFEVAGLADLAGPLASAFFDRPDRAMDLVAVTGTDGKTSVCRFAASALAGLGVRAGYVGTIGWGVLEPGAAPGDLAPSALTTPDVVALRRMLAALRDAGCRAVALEASSHGIAEGRLDGLALDVAVLTNLGRDHLDYHGTLEAYGAAKARLFDAPGLGAAVLNANDALGRTLAERLARRAADGRAAPRVATFATRADGAGAGSGAGAGASAPSAAVPAPGPDAAPTYVGADVVASPRGLDFALLEGGARTAVSSPLLGRFNVDNLLACHGVLRALGVAAPDAAAALGALGPVPGRMERIAAPGGGDDDGPGSAHGAGPVAIVDYAHTPGALGAAIAAARAHCPGRLHVVFGCGGDRDPGKRAPMARAAEGADRVVVTSDNPRTEDPARIVADILEGFADPGAVEVVPERRAAIDGAVAAAGAGDVVLVAGKGHEAVQIVGTEHREFDDRRVVAAALARRARAEVAA